MIKQNLKGNKISSGHYLPCKIYPLVLACIKANIWITLIKNKIKFFSYIRKFRVEQLQSHI
jgi:hypothetical protein